MTKTPFKRRCAGYAERVRSSFARQGAAMPTLGTRMGLLLPGAMNIEMAWARELTPQEGFLHARGMAATALDSACGYAGFTLMAEKAAVLTNGFKINLLAPAKQAVSHGRPRRQARPHHHLCEGRAFAVYGSQEKVMATIGCTLMAVAGREAIQY